MAHESLQSLDAVLAGLHSLAETAESVEDEQIRLRLTGAVVGLRAVVLNVRGQILQLQDAYEQLAEQNRQASQAAAPSRDKPIRMKWGCYQFDDSEGLFCTVCYDSKGRRVRATRKNSSMLVCPNCRATFSVV
jgi:hypothetical protein